jgi:hypothetical protein
MMVKFVEIETAQGSISINPDQVRYLGKTRDGKTSIVFGAMPGGFDQVVTQMALSDVLVVLKGADEARDLLATALRRHGISTALTAIYGPPIPIFDRTTNPGPWDGSQSP